MNGRAQSLRRARAHPADTVILVVAPGPGAWTLGLELAAADLSRFAGMTGEPAVATAVPGEALTRPAVAGRPGGAAALVDGGTTAASMNAAVHEAALLSAAGIAAVVVAPESAPRAASGAPGHVPVVHAEPAWSAYPPELAARRLAARVRLALGWTVPCGAAISA